LRKVGLAPARYLDRILAKTLSGGERKRIELAALVGLRPRLALLDESAAGIDLRSVDKIVAIVYELKKAGSAVLLISHREEMARVADRASQL
jgi:Fe-S cluster assembly ATP-binding protein